MLSKQLLSQSGDLLFLHGDLHMGNILLDGNEWLAIDPKGVVAPKEFDAACFDFITADELLISNNIPEIFDDRLIYLAKLLAIDHCTLKNWVFIRLLLATCWMIEDLGKPGVFVDLIQAIFPDRF